METSFLLTLQAMVTAGYLILLIHLPTKLI
ncbi:hypothetical protein F4694_004294 [Bacillus niacini]|uniref:Uncharacterized protein n=1 Tax=Neobacillus niacini TaxID=86668 RepID=A0A852TFA0_9BACI|nr:hypothetical protein [Neobacillus niacini]